MYYRRGNARCSEMAEFGLPASVDTGAGMNPFEPFHPFRRGGHTPTHIRPQTWKIRDIIIYNFIHHLPK
jgi:hypothetical protein